MNQQQFPNSLMNQQQFPTSFWTGRQASLSQAPTKSPQQSQFMNQLLQQLGPQANQAFDFQPIAQAATQRFNEQTLPSIAERFAGMNSKRSSGYEQALANAQGGLQQQLAGQQAQFGLQSQGNLAKLLGLGLQPQFENNFDPGASGGFMQLLQALFEGLGKGGGMALGGMI